MRYQLPHPWDGVLITADPVLADVNNVLKHHGSA
jgi:hypothetical protein